MMWWGNGGWGAGNWTAMVLMMVVFWGAVITVGVWALRRGRAGVRDGGSLPPVDRADRELAERFARGEIDEAQFTRTRSILHSGDSSRPDSPV